MPIEIIFKGLFSVLNVGFLSELIVNARAMRFNYPEEFVATDLSQIVDIFNKAEYVDFVVTTNRFVINESAVPNVFINLTKDGNDAELLVYFDYEDVNRDIGIDKLIGWANVFQKKINFEYHVCQMDNADENEYYFDSNSKGPLYAKLKK